jgi:hypothetical protein
MRKSQMRGAVGAGVAASMLGVCGMAAGAVDAMGDELAMVKVIEQTYRGVQVEFDQGRPHTIAGQPMTGGVTPRDASQFWLQNYGAALGGSGSELVESWTADFANNAEFSVFCYQQTIAGLPVEYGIAKVLVLHAPGNPVVYAAGTLAPAPAAGFAPMKVDGATAVALVRAHEEYNRVPTWSRPELVVYQGLGDWTAPVRAWKFVGESARLADPFRKTFFVGAANGQIVGVRDEVVYDVGGTITGKGSPGPAPDVATNPPPPPSRCRCRRSARPAPWAGRSSATGTGRTT